MISAIQPKTQPSFTSVIPVKVFIDGLETFDEKLIKSSCRQLGNILAGPSPKEPQVSIIRKFGQYDNHYSVEKGIKGYPKEPHHKNIHPSEFFRTVIEYGKTFLITGPQAEQLHTLGKAIGNEKQACNERRVAESFDLMVAKKNYGRTLLNIITNSKLRLAEVVENSRKMLTLNINMKSNKKYGLSTFKIKLDDINFTK